MLPTITLDDISCLLHLLIGGISLDRGRIEQEDEVGLMITLLGVDPGKAAEEAAHTRAAHALFSFL